MNQVAAKKPSGSDDKNNVSAPAQSVPAVPAVPVFKVGSEVGAVGVLQSDPAQEQAGPHQSILDFDIPEAGQVDFAEAPSDLMRQESFLTEVEDFQNTAETFQLSSELETQLRPVFELCQPNSDGLISIEHLRAMCREHGQVNYKYSSVLIVN